MAPDWVCSDHVRKTSLPESAAKAFDLTSALSNNEEQHMVTSCESCLLAKQNSAVEHGWLLVLRVPLGCK